MVTIFVEVGALCVALVLAVYVQIYPLCKKSRDCLLFGRLLLATAAIFVVDTLGWVIDGHPIGGAVWFTTLVDGVMPNASCQFGSPFFKENISITLT